MDGSTKEKRCSLVRKLRQQFSGNPIRRNKCDLKYIARVEFEIIETVEFRKRVQRIHHHQHNKN